MAHQGRQPAAGCEKDVLGQSGKAKFSTPAHRPWAGLDRRQRDPWRSFGDHRRHRSFAAAIIAGRAGRARANSPPRSTQSLHTLSLQGQLLAPSRAELAVNSTTGNGLICSCTSVGLVTARLRNATSSPCSGSRPLAQRLSGVSVFRNRRRGSRRVVQARVFTVRRNDETQCCQVARLVGYLSMILTPAA